MFRYGPNGAAALAVLEFWERERDVRTRTGMSRRAGVRGRAPTAVATAALLLAGCGDAADDSADDAPEVDTEATNEGTDSGDEPGDDEQATIECDDTVNLQYAFITPEGSAYDVGGRAFEEHLDSAAPGCFEFSSFPDGQLGNELDIEQAMQEGAIQMGVGAQALEAFVDEAPLFMTPFLFDGREHMEAVIESDITDDYEEFVLNQGNFKVLGYFTAGDRHILSSQEIRSTEDLEGLQLRVPESRLQIDIWRELGVNSVDLPFGDLYSGLQTGTVDAIELDPALIRAMSLYEVADYYVLTDHLTGAYPLIMDANFYNGLDADRQTVIDEAGRVAQDANQEFDTAGVEESLEALSEEHGIEVIEIDNTELRQRTRSVYGDYEETLPPELVERILELEP